MPLSAMVLIALFFFWKDNTTPGTLGGILFGSVPGGYMIFLVEVNISVVTVMLIKLNISEILTCC